MRIDLLKNTYSAPEIEFGCKLPSRAMELLKREGLAPKTLTEGGRGKMAMFDFASLCRFASIGAIANAPTSLLAAARISNAVCDELIDTYGEIPFGKNDLAREIVDQNNNAPDEIFDSILGINPIAVYHLALVKAKLKPGDRLGNDYRLLIADGEYVYSGGDPRLSVYSSALSKGIMHPPELKIGPVERGGDVTVTRIDQNDKTVAQEFEDYLDRTVSMLQFNFSLAVRNALGRILERRQAGIVGADIAPSTRGGA